jgi:DNA ligase (NAD+)
MIIPQIYSAEKSEEFSGREFSLIQTCPICGKFSTKVVESDSGVLNMYCTNPDCDGKLINKLDHFCNKHGLDIKGLSTATLEKLIDLGWLTCYEDIYKLYEHQEDWEKLPGFGEKSVFNILEAIKKSQNCSLESFITAIGIPLIGRNVSKELCKYIDSYEDFRNKVDERFDFSALDGFGDVKSENILKFDYTEADKVFDYLNIVKSDNNQEKTLNNITVVITGKLSHFKNRDELKKVIEDMGGKVTGSVSGNTTYLINNNSTSTTGKNLTAKKLGIPILTEDDFIQKFLTNEKNSAII